MLLEELFKTMMLPFITAVFPPKNGVAQSSISGSASRSATRSTFHEYLEALRRHMLPRAFNK